MIVLSIGYICSIAYNVPIVNTRSVRHMRIILYANAIEKFQYYKSTHQSVYFSLKHFLIASMDSKTKRSVACCTEGMTFMT